MSARSIDNGDGTIWVVNMSEFRFAHGMRNGVYFDPKQPTRVVPDEWIKSQPLLVEIKDPFGALPESPLVVETPLMDDQTKKPVTGVGTGPQGSGNGDDVRAKKK